MSAPQSQVDHIRDDGLGGFEEAGFEPAGFETGSTSTRRFCDYEHKRAPTYLKFLAGSVEISRALPDRFTGVQLARRATVPFLNRDLEDPECDTSTALPFGDENIGDAMTVRLRDLDGSTTLDEISGVIASLSGSDDLAIEVSADDEDIFKNLLPRRKLIDVYPTVDLTLARESDPSIRIPFGTMRKVPLYKVSEIAGLRYDYGAFRRNQTGTFTLATIYRGTGQVVPPSEYQLIESPVGYLVVRFAIAQRDRNGNSLPIWADVICTELSNPATAILFLLSDATHGLGLSCDATTFAAAVTAYSTLGYQLSGGLWSSTPALDLLPFVMLRGALLDRNAAQRYTYLVDAAAAHPVAPIQLGFGDLKPYNWTNIANVLTDLNTRAQTRVKKYVLSSLPDWGFTGTPKYLATTDPITAAGKGIDKEEKSEFLGHLATLKKEARYRAEVLAKGTIRTVTGAPELMQVPLGGRVKLYAPSRKITGEEFFVQRKVSGSGAITLDLMPYSDIWSQPDATCTPLPEAAYLTDYRFTFPAAPTGLTLGAMVIRTSPSGQDEVWGPVTATAPAVNVTHLVWRVRLSGQAGIFSESVVEVTPGQASVASELRFPPGEDVQLSVRARNINNDPAFQDGEVANLGEIIQVPHLETGAPTNNPAALSIVSTDLKDGSRTDKLSWTYTQGAKPADGFVLYYQAGIITTPTGNVQDLGDTALDYTKSWPQDHSVSYGIAAYRVTRLGREIGPLQQIAGWRVTGAVNPNYTGNIDGTSAVSIRLGAETNVNEGSLVDGSPISLPDNAWTDIMTISGVVVPAEAIDAQVQIQGNLTFRYKTDDELNQLRWRALRDGVAKYTANGRTVIKTGATFRTEDIYVMLAHENNVPSGATYTYKIQAYFDTNIGTSNYVGDLRFPSFATFTVKSR
ncbi:MAG: hypothetical protein EWM72_02770 [Nitrospira sp.]|nr:MAG: hypothetical protein EWM72_02770 [Nitrospira sp.]